MRLKQDKRGWGKESHCAWCIDQRQRAGVCRKGLWAGGCVPCLREERGPRGAGVTKHRPPARSVESRSAPQPWDPHRSTPTPNCPGLMSDLESALYSPAGGCWRRGSWAPIMVRSPLRHLLHVSSPAAVCLSRSLKDGRAQPAVSALSSARGGFSTNDPWAWRV